MSTFNGKVVGGGLNLRQSASSSATILIQIPENTNLTLVAEAGKDAWFRTTYNNYTGYVMARYIAIENDGGTCQVTTASGRLNVRQTPSSSASIIHKEEQNAIVRLLDSTSVNGWYRISSSQGTGWGMSTYLTILTEPDDDIVTPGDTTSTTATTRYNNVICYKTAAPDSENIWGTFPISTNIPVWFISERNIYYKTVWSANGVDNIGYVFSGDVTLTEDNYGTLDTNSSGNSVINCKWRLFELGYHPDDFRKDYNSVTEAAVKVFQEKNDLTITGTINSATRSKINNPATLTWLQKVGSWTSEHIPYQWYMGDSKWRTHPFPARDNPTGTIEMDGNSITAMSMLLTSFANRAVTPVEMAEFAIAYNYRDQSGTSGVIPSFYTQIGNYYDCVMFDKQVSSLSAVDTELSKGGRLAIIEVNKKNETFTKGRTQLVCYTINNYVYLLTPNKLKEPAPFTVAEWNSNGWFETAYIYIICNG